MNFQFRNNVWKGDSTNSVIPTNSRPFTGSDESLKTLARTQGKANPYKHWRKQLLPYYKTKSSKQVSIDTLEAPSSVVYVDYNTSNLNYDNCSTTNSQLLKENIILLNDCKGVKHVYEDENNKTRCIGGTNNVRKSASTNLSKGYYRNYSKYLQAKCKTYEQNQKLGSKISEYKFKSQKCTSDSLNCDKPVIYKPNNKAFMQQGSVSASTNIIRKRNNAITNNGASLKTAYGNSAVSVQPYYSGRTGYEIKYVKGNNEDTNECQRVFKSCK